MPIKSLEELGIPIASIKQNSSIPNSSRKIKSLEELGIPIANESSEIIPQQSSLPKYKPPENMEEVYKNIDEHLANQTPEQQKVLLSDIVRLAVKAPAAGIGSILDFFITAPNNALGQAYNVIAPEGYQHTPAPYLEENIEKGIDILSEKAGLDTSKKTPLSEGIKFATSLAAPGGLAKTAAIKASPKIAQALESIGSINPKTIAGAVGAGAGIEKARESGEGIGGQLASGVGGTIAAEALANPKQALKGIGKETSKLAAKGLGLGKENIKTEAIDAAQRLGMEGLPAAAVTDSIVNGYVNQLISKTPVFGNKLRQSAKEASDQFQKSWNEMLDSIAPGLNHELDKEAKLIYKQSNNLIGKNDLISPDIILNKIKELREFLKSPTSSRATKELLKVMDELETGLSSPKSLEGSSFIKELEEKASKLMSSDSGMTEEIKKQVLEKIKQTTSQKEIYAPEILRAKIELNKIMRDKNIFDRRDTDTLGFLKSIQGSIKETLEEYGKTNPKWFSAFKEAEEKYSKFARRSDIEDLVSGIIRDYNTGEVKYHSLINTLENPENRNILKNGLGENNFKKIEDFVKVAQAMSSINKNILNPSGSATVGSVLLAIQSLVFRANPFPALATTVGAKGITKLLTDKKFINKVSQFSKDPNETIAKQIDNIIKNHTGLGAQTLVKPIKEKEENEE